LGEQVSNKAEDVSTKDEDTSNKVPQDLKMSPTSTPEKRKRRKMTES
jgi:hypothetical protein